MENKNQKINCDVETCDYQDNEENICTLEEIKVGSCCDDPSHKDETACKSFKNSQEN